MKVAVKTKAKLKSLNKRRRDYLAARPHRSFRKTRPARKTPPLATISQVFIGSWKTIWKERKLLVRLGLIYMLATYIFVGGVTQTDFVTLKDTTVGVIGGSFNSFGTVFSLLTSTMSGVFSGGLTELQQFLGVLFAILFWLAVVWVLRMRFANQTIKARDALYNSAAPLVAYVLLALLVAVQLVPGAAAVAIFTIGQNGGYLQGGVEVFSFAAAAAVLAILSLYWAAGSLVALVIVTLPQMYPWRALQVAGELAIGRRLRLFGHVLWLAGTLLLIWVVGLLPALLLDAWLHFDWLPLVPIVVQLLGAVSVIYFGAYVYRLYRSML